MFPRFHAIYFMGLPFGKPTPVTEETMPIPEFCLPNILIHLIKEALTKTEYKISDAYV